MAFKSGFISVIGRPNVGKSTLVNAITGRKLSIISDKPQTTRNTIKSIITTDEYQLVFIDTPGIHKPKTMLGEYMVKVATETLQEVDAVLFMVDSESGVTPGKGDSQIISQLHGIKTPVILIINKIDLIQKDTLLPMIENYGTAYDFAAVIPVSAVTGEGLDRLKDELVRILPEGPQYFPEDTITDQPERFIVAEIIREKMLQLLEDEVPHGTGVEVISFKEKPEDNFISIEANIYCEKESHKGIIIGKNGRMLKTIGTNARMDIERLFSTHVYLQLWVKTKKDWRNDSYMLRSLGYK